jgi:hypothetical protein
VATFARGATVDRRGIPIALAFGATAGENSRVSHFALANLGGVSIRRDAAGGVAVAG